MNRIVAAGSIALALLTIGCQTGNRVGESGGLLPPHMIGDGGDRWLGRWPGPSGTLLLLSRSGGRVTIQFRTLNGPITYEGVTVGDHVEFVRHGVKETIRSSNGWNPGVGPKVNGHDCLFIEPDEAYCRN